MASFLMELSRREVYAERANNVHYVALGGRVSNALHDYINEIFLPRR